MWPWPFLHVFATRHVRQIKRGDTLQASRSTRGRHVGGAAFLAWQKICQRLEVDQMSLAIRETFWPQDSLGVKLLTFYLNKIQAKSLYDTQSYCSYLSNFNLFQKYQIKCAQEFRNYEIYQFPKGFLRGLGLQSSLCAHSLPHSGEIPLKFRKELLQI